MTRCEACPRVLTKAELAKNHTQCAVCRGERQSSYGKPIVVNSNVSGAKPQKNEPGDSWWVKRSPSKLSAEVARRFTK